MSEITLNVFVNTTVDVGDFSVIPSIDESRRANGWPKWVLAYKVRKIQELPMFSLVHDWILNGKSDREVTQGILQHGYFVNEHQTTVMNYVSHYRATIPKAFILARQHPSKMRDVQKKFLTDADLIERKEAILEKMRKRVESWETIEMASQIPLTETLKEIREYNSTLDELVALRHKLGLTDSKLSAIVTRAEQHKNYDRVYTKEGINKILADPQSRVKVLGVVERMLDMAKQAKAKESIKETAKAEAVEPEPVVGPEIDLNNLQYEDLTSEAEESDVEEK